MIVTLLVAVCVGAASFVGWHAAERAIDPRKETKCESPLTEMVACTACVLIGAELVARHRRNDTAKP